MPKSLKVFSPSPAGSDFLVQYQLMKTRIALFALLASAAVQAAQVVDVKFKALDGFGGDTGSIASR